MVFKCKNKCEVPISVRCYLFDPKNSFLSICFRDFWQVSVLWKIDPKWTANKTLRKNSHIVHFCSLNQLDIITTEMKIYIFFCLRNGETLSFIAILILYNIVSNITGRIFYFSVIVKLSVKHFKLWLFW